MVGSPPSLLYGCLPGSICSAINVCPAHRVSHSRRPHRRVCQRVHPRQDCGTITSAIPLGDKVVLDVPTSKRKKNTIKHAATRNKFLLWQQGMQRELASKSPI